jgi:uncharacterized membrane protein
MIIISFPYIFAINFITFSIMTLVFIFGVRYGRRSINRYPYPELSGTGEDAVK